MHEVLANRLGGVRLLRKSVVRLTDRPNMTLDVYRGRKTTIQQQQLSLEKSCVHSRRHSFDPNFVTIKSWTNLKLCHIGSKSRSLDQILEKPFYTLET